MSQSDDHSHPHPHEHPHSEPLAPHAPLPGAGEGESAAVSNAPPTPLIYVDCFSGISGDMLLGALLDAGLPLAALEAGLAKLDLGGYRLELRPKQAETEFERVLLGLQDDELRMMTMEDAFGLRTEIHFSGLERNATISADLFSFTPPEGVDVIGGPAVYPLEHPEAGSERDLEADSSQR